MRLDKNYYIKQSFNEAADHRSQYKRMSAEVQSDTFRFMMEAAYGFVDLPWPKMDKQHFEKKSPTEER